MEERGRREERARIVELVNQAPSNQARLERTHMFHIRRVKMDDNPNRGDVRWILFRHGELFQPLAVLSTHELDVLLNEVREQILVHGEAVTSEGEQDQ